MSSRVFRKLQGQNGVPLPPELLASTAEAAAQGPPDLGGARPKQLNINPFDLLNPDSLSESEVKEDDDLGTESTRSQLHRENTRRKKRKKNRKRSQNSQSGGPGGPPKSSGADEFEDEIERSLHEVNQILGTASAGAQGHRDSLPKVLPKYRNVLNIEYRHLNPENEMKKIFGSRVVQAEASRQRRAGGRHRAPLRSTHNIVVPKPNWPNPGKTGLTMKFVRSEPNGNQVFAFHHNTEYQTVQKHFLQAVESMNPDFIVQILNQHPFHIDSMLQLSDICKMGEDLQMATELIERCIYALEAAFHPMFNLAAGNCRLDYKVQVNRCIFIALFRHLHFVGSRACHRTALEFAKLILSLDPDADPVGVLLLIDFYAIKSLQHNWLTNFYEEWEPKRNLSQLPNWAYSISIAYFAQADESPEKDYTKADEMLQRALIMFPNILAPLLDKCSIEPDSKVLTHSYFVEAQLNQATSGLELLCNLYVGRSFHLWKLPELLPWLERNANTVIQRLDINDDFVKICTEKRKTRYQGAPRNVYRHVLMSDVKDATTSLPRELAETPVLSFDPLPPSDSIDTYTKDDHKSRTGIEDPNALGLFFRSMLPSFNVNAPPVPGQPGEEGAEGAPGGGAAMLRNSVNSLYEAMNDLLDWQGSESESVLVESESVEALQEIAFWPNGTLRGRTGLQEVDRSGSSKHRDISYQFYKKG
eukprot:maker-scaffold292_size219010-snap-gene-1.35 protein:Tk00320 transcript:maker-scaffold292_size219010-snap-gene-1.35-mRNA-1 annotation:"transcription factor 25"